MSDRVREDEGEVDSHLIESGKILDGRYEVIEFLGAGAFAAVYKAKQLNIKRNVALKVLNIINAWQDAATRKAFGDRFLREAQTAAQIRHPNVVTIYDFGIIEDLGQPFIVMELLEGHDLEEELNLHGPMDAERAIELMLGSLEALGEGHELGIVHKDLKPANLFITDPGTRREKLKIVDFGIARIQEEEGQKLTGTGQLFGTPQYLAPEYIERQIAKPALDVYQMGLILVEMLTARTVVDVDNPYKCLMMHCNGELPIPPSLLEGAHGAVLKKALEVDWESRYTDAHAFGDALKTLDPKKMRVVDYDADTLRAMAEAPTMAGERSPSAYAGTDVLAQPRATPTPANPLPQPGDVGLSPEPAAAAGGYDTAPSELIEGPSKTPYLLLALAGVLALVLFAGISYLLVGDKDGDAMGAVDSKVAMEEGGQKPEEKPPVEEGEQPTDKADEVPSEAAVPPKEDVAKEAPAAEPVSVEITSDQQGARVFVGDEDRGETPVQLTFKGPDDEAIEVRLEKEGFEVASMKVGPKDGPSIEATLAPKALEDSRASSRAERRKAARAARKAKADGGDKVEAKVDDKPADKPKKGMGFVEEKKQPEGTTPKKKIGFIE